MKRIECNLQTKEIVEIELTPAEILRLQELENDRINKIPYGERRAAEYPSFADQFDLLYHGGYEAWKASIQAIKDKYPKT